MDFEYTPEQIQLRKSVREFAENEIAPHVMEWDEGQIFPLETIRKLGALGYMGAIFPEELGGAGFGYIEYSIIIEELSRVDGSVGIILAAHTSLCSNHIFKMGTDEQRRRYLPKLASGEWIGCWSLTEPEAGSDAAGTRTHAELDHDEWVLNGAKTFTTNAHYADVCVAMAVTDRAAAQHGISAFLVEKST
ncbi:MAG TPA: acyl-CoA dehydrogenase family protein, partial [Bryobacteraceae bacterium]|nr:acyl-CoA dehydrogenase family protein [Bryobacteraceae bacterium]